MNALRALEYAVAAPLPRRRRTWVHRISVALDALADALREQLVADDDRFGLLTEIALSEPGYAGRVGALRSELLELSVAVASLRERIEPDPTLDPDPALVRDELAALTSRFRRHQLARTELVREATGIDISDVEPTTEH